jgi:hypothetical protein
LTQVGGLTYEEFWESLVRTALLIYRDEGGPTATTTARDKLQKLFLKLTTTMVEAVHSTVGTWPAGPLGRGRRGAWGMMVVLLLRCGRVIF